MPALVHTLQQIRRRVAHKVWGPDTLRPNGICRHAPEWLVLVVNNNCNLKCKMCDVGLGDSATVFYSNLIGDDPRNMSLDLLQNLLRQASRFSPKPKIGLGFTEPLIHANILDFCRLIVAQGFYCSITTNGFMLPRLAQDLIEIGVHHITVSVDGPQDVHNKIRGRKNSFQKLYEGIEKLRSLRTHNNRPALQLSYTLTDENYTHMIAFLDEVLPLEPASIVFSHLNFITQEMADVHNAKVDKELAVSRSNLGTIDPKAIDLPAMWEELKAVKALIQRRDDLPPIRIVPDVSGLDDLQTYYHNPLTFIGGRRCSDPWKMALIRTDGSVIPAHGRCYDFPVGNITETDLVDLWNNDRFRTFRQLLHHNGGTLPACTRCCGVIGKPRNTSVQN